MNTTSVKGEVMNFGSRLANIARSYLEGMKARLLEMEYILQSHDGVVLASSVDGLLKELLASVTPKVYAVCNEACGGLNANPLRVVISEGKGKLYVVKPLPGIIASLVIRGDLPLGLILLEMESLDHRLRKEVALKDES